MTEPIKKRKKGATRQSRVVSKFVGGVPPEFDPLDRDDLGPHFKGLPKGKPISWGLVIAAAHDSWTSYVHIPGIDWVIGLYPPGELKIPRARRSASGRARWKTITQHCGLLTVNTGQTNINVARDIGRPAVRALLGIARREFPFLIPSNVLWEGAITRREKGKLGMTAADSDIRAKKPADPKRLSSVGLTFAALSFLKMPAHLRRSLVWLSLARSARVRIERFMHLWLAALALVSYGQPVGAGDMPRIENYTASMGTGSHGGGVISQPRIKALNNCFQRANEARNHSFHRDDDSLITLPLVEDLENAIFELVDFELAKVGTPIIEGTRGSSSG